MNRLDRELVSLEEQARGAPADVRGRLLNQAGDRCVRAGELDRALRYYGGAIDVYLEIERPRSAAAMCRKVLRVAPHVVRARRTLTLLAIGEGYMGDAHRQVEAYVSAARKKGQHGLAVSVLRLLGEMVGDPVFRGHLADKLEELGDRTGAEQMASAAEGQEAEGAGAGETEEETESRWARILRIALMGPDRLRDAGRSR